ncbi:MAG: hypothetical protein ACYC5K_07210 [Saccharofermentanales bacterium]
MKILKLSLGMIFNPIYTFQTLQLSRGKVNYYAASLLLLLIPVIRIVYIFGVHYPLSPTNPLNADYAVEIATYTVPILSFIVANFCITSIFDGETLLGESFAAGAFAMMPYLVFTIPLMTVSRFSSLSEYGIYSFLQGAIIAWCVLLTFIGVKEMNGYSLFKTVIIYMVIVASILLLLALVMLLYALMNQVYLFLTGVISEIIFNLRYK